MIDFSYTSLGLLLWLGSSILILSIKSDNSVKIAKKSHTYQHKTTNNNHEDNTNLITNLKADLEIKIQDLTLANERIKALEEEIQSLSDRLEYNEDKYLRLIQQWEDKVKDRELKITLLENKCQKLNEEINNISSNLTKDWQEKSFHLLQTLLVNYPTAKIMVKIKPDLPAENVINFLKPLDKILTEWGIETIGKPWEKVLFNPELHYSEEENLNLNEEVYIRFVGYKHDNKILLPARVSRTLPGQHKRN